MALKLLTIPTNQPSFTIATLALGNSELKNTSFNTLAATKRACWRYQPAKKEKKTRRAPEQTGVSQDKRRPHKPPTPPTLVVAVDNGWGPPSAVCILDITSKNVASTT